MDGTFVPALTVECCDKSNIDQSRYKRSIMDGFLARRAQDTRFQNERRVPGGGSSAVWTTPWYAGTRIQVEKHTFSASDYKSGDSNHKMTPHKDDDDQPKKKKKKTKDETFEFSKSGEAFTKKEEKKLEDRTSSDDSDGGPCWSDYERVPGEGELTWF